MFASRVVAEAPTKNEVVHGIQTKKESSDSSVIGVGNAVIPIAAAGVFTTEKPYAPKASSVAAAASGRMYSSPRVLTIVLGPSSSVQVMD